LRARARAKKMLRRTGVGIRREDNLLDLLGGAAELMVEHPQRGTPSIRVHLIALTEMRLQHLQRLRHQLVERSLPRLLDRRPTWTTTEPARPDSGGLQLRRA
jgi:hypothetical protein